MTAYMISLIDVRDPEQYKEYQKRAGPALAKYGGRFIVRGGKYEVVEGKFDHQRVVVVEFPDVETAKRFYASPEYQEARSYRLPVSEFQAIIVEGLPPA
jgi:uncharacterized protein (DUF1330 family)